MPDHQFSVHPDPNDLARLDLAAGLSRPARTGESSAHPSAATSDATHHGARDDRQAARSRSRSERDRTGRAAGAGAGASRSYVFRRS